MIRLILITLLFLLSLLTVFRAPTNLLWLVSILVTEFCWVFFILVVVLLLWRFGGNRYATLTSFVGIVSLVLYAVPVIGAISIAPKVRQLFQNDVNQIAITAANQAPFSLTQMIMGIHAKKVPYKILTYDSTNQLTLDFYPASSSAKRPCIIIVHGGSWAGGDSQQLPELNSALAQAGYHVSTINYRLAPNYHYPVPIEDVKTALTFLRSNAANLKIDTTKFVLLGRSAGAQIVLSAAYTLHDPNIKGVISFYGPADMVGDMQTQPIPLFSTAKKLWKIILVEQFCKCRNNTSTVRQRQLPLFTQFLHY